MILAVQDSTFNYLFNSILGGKGVGFIADLSSSSVAIQIVAWIAIASGVFVLLKMKETRKASPYFAEEF